MFMKLYINAMSHKHDIAFKSLTACKISGKESFFLFFSFQYGKGEENNKMIFQASMMAQW